VNSDWPLQAATTLHERLMASGDTLRPSSSSADATSVVHRWRERVSPGEWAGLDRRLGWIGLDRDSAARRLAAFRFPVQPAAQPWMATLAALQARIAAVFEAPTTSCESPIEAALPRSAEASLPFEELLRPVADHAYELLAVRLGNREGCPSERLSTTAARDLKRALLAQLTAIAAPTLFSEFCKLRPYGLNFALGAAGTTQVTGSRTLYDSFVRQQGSDCLARVFAQYPMLGRMLATRVELWIDSLADFLQRLEEDWESILDTLVPTAHSSSSLAHVRTNLSDPHEGGRSVLVLELEGGARVVYKPRGLALHHAFNEFASWLNAALGLRIATGRVLVRDGYGWMEYVDSQACNDAHEAELFFHDTGVLLCVLYLLGATDCHFENLIASGGRLVLVDTETLMHADLVRNESASRRSDWDPIQDSVLRTGLLPSWEFSPDGSAAFDLSGLGSHAIPSVLQRRLGWLAVNTDEMHRGQVEVSVSRSNLPTLSGQRLTAADYLPQLLRGFESCYRSILRERDTLLGPHGPLESFRGHRSRFVFRPTNVYAGILSQCLLPDACREGIAWGLQLEHLAQALMAMEDSDFLAPFLCAEIESMTRLDIPYFAVQSDARTISVVCAGITHSLPVAGGFDSAVRRIRAMSADDMSFQVEAIRCAFAAHQAAGVRPSALPRTADSKAPIALTPALCMDEAVAIAESLSDRAMADGRGRLRWLGFQYVPEADRLQVGPIPQGLYAGRCGIALFLAALDAVSGAQRFRPLREGAMQPFLALRAPNAPERRVFAASGIGLAEGFGGILFSIARMAAFVPSDERETLIDMGHEVAGFMTPQLLEQDRTLDMLGGCAGAIVGLLALHECTMEQSLLDQATLCGRRLVAGYSEALGLATDDSMPLAGFAHGASGIAYALHRLFVSREEACFLETANAALAHERRLFDDAEGNWPDLRWRSSQQEARRFQVSWCHGAPGIALARLGILKHHAASALETEWEMAVTKTSGEGLLDVDNLCCGNLGLCDVLMVSAQHGGNGGLRDSAMARAARVLHRARERGAFRLMAAIPDPVFSPGFFQGVAGIGYQFLRLGFPDKVPSVLSLDTSAN
jgi:type 2 lantibiotic biosynthesis protein LanM